MKQEIEVQAVRIHENELVSLKLGDPIPLSKKSFLLEMLIKQGNYFILVNGKKKYFKYSKDGLKLIEPPIEDLKKAMQF